MNNFLALLEGRTLTNATKAFEILDRANEAGSIYNIELKEVKDDLSRAIYNAMRATLTYSEDHKYTAAQTEFHYWSAGLAGTPSILKRLLKLQVKDDAQEVKNAIAWLSEVAPYAAIVKSLKDKVIMGRRPSETPVVVDVTNTGTCAICGRLHKLSKAKKMVDHGFIITLNGRPLYHRHGNCFGVGYAPYELSNEANVALEPIIANDIARTKKHIDFLEKNLIEQFEWTTQGEYNRATGKREMIQNVATKGSPEHEKRRQIELANAEGDLHFHEANKKINDRMINEWVLKDLPGEFTK